MIHTITLNPALDYVMNIPELELGETNRSITEEIFGGGKGINVAIVARNLGHEVSATGFLAGFTGQELRRLIKEKQITDTFVEVKKGQTRINVKLKEQTSEGRRETEINANGPIIEEEDVKALYEKIAGMKDGDFLVLSGSIPPTVPKDIYQRIMENFAEKKFNVVVDATGELLTNTLKYKPFLIKPNVAELEELAGTALKTEEEIVNAARELQALGARNVVISMGGKGAIMLSEENQVLKVDAPMGTLVNSVGSGDSLVSAFICKYKETKNYNQTFKYAVSAGSATAFTAGLATKEQVEELYRKM